MADSGSALLNAAAQVRALLVEGAAKRLGVAPNTLTTADAVIRAPDGRTMTYGDAIRTVDLHRNAAPTSPLKNPSTFAVIGTSLPRVDIPNKVTGGVSYVQDMQLPGMLHARVVMPPVYDAKLLSFDEAAILKLPGVVRIVRNGSMLAVVAQGEWQAVVAQRALAAGCRWSPGRKLPDRATVHADLKRISTQRIEIANTHATTAPAAKTLNATFLKNYLLHGSIGPSCSVAHLENGMMTVWTHSQGVYPLRDALAQMLSMPKANVRCIHTEGSGCYGHNGADDVAAHAALIAAALPGKPIRVQWMREQEHVGSLHAGDGDRGQCVARRERPHRRLELRAVEQLAQRADRRRRPAAARAHAGAAVRARAVDADAAARRRRRPQRDPAVHAAEPAHRQQLLADDAAADLRDALARRAHQRLGDRKLHGRARARGRRRSGRVPTAPHGRPSRAPGHQARRDALRLAAAAAARNRGVGFAFGKYKNLMAYVAIAVEVSIVPETGRSRSSTRKRPSTPARSCRRTASATRSKAASCRPRAGRCTRR
jgi:hypothetical protein